ncbi:uncharacterized protein LY89DRAFT_778560 [Mollisia scopiformis]|uniref:Uncharacterized protein n=1 Tax=Mollisia scopiformis TaxID=149040 RepID=A0A194XLF1_MOLSC|nr:uncharacterized protein LY89DRAFT_778560 [Mollisia scopiformis]KUJ20914.1 hypothetical protein LY89DRAFT_778560 [Mollisia scopiformis]
MASTTPIRRPLGNLNRNHALTPQGTRNVSEALKSTSKSVFVDKILQTTTRGGTTTTDEVGSEGGLDGEKRVISDDGNGVRASKRQRIMATGAQVDVRQYDLSSRAEVQGGLDEDESAGVYIERDDEFEQPEPLESDLGFPSQETPSSPVSSAGSSIPSPTAAVNESQNTTITEPDDIQVLWPVIPNIIAVPRPLTVEEVKQKAKEIRLRLSLANYKVRTNQIDVPISRLQIRSSTFPNRLGLSGASRVSRTPLPSASLHNISLQKPSAEKSRIFSASIPSSPPSKVRPGPTSRLASPTKQRDSVADGLSTPLLPRQREGLLNPPMLGSPEERHLTSSVVKGRAADGLLSLMRHQG